VAGVSKGRWVAQGLRPGILSLDKRRKSRLELLVESPEKARLGWEGLEAMPTRSENPISKRSQGALTRISHQREAVGRGRRKGGALAPPGARASLPFIPRLPYSPVPAGLCGRRGRATISGTGAGGAKAPPFPAVVRNPG